MNPKTAITAVLLLFVAACVVVLVVNPPDGGSQSAGPENTEPPLSDGVIAYYFYRTKRCTDCETIQAYAHEAIETGFRKRLEAGTLQWRPANFEEKENRPLKERYNIAAPTVVLVRMDGGRPKQSKTLTQVWKLLKTADKQTFIDYVQRETKTFLKSCEV